MTLQYSIKKIMVCLCIFCIVGFFCVAETISFSADSMNGRASDDNDYTRLIGNAFVKTDSMELSADTIEISGKDYRYIDAKGNVSGAYTADDFTFEADSIRYDREKEIARLQNNISMTDTENDVQISAGYIEYDQNTEIAFIQIDVEIIQDKSVCTAAFAVYRKALQILELSGSPKIVRNDDVFQAREIIFNLETEEITLIGKVQGTVTAEDKNE